MDLQERTVFFVRSIPTCFSQKPHLKLQSALDWCTGISAVKLRQSWRLFWNHRSQLSSQWQRWPNSTLSLTNWEDGAHVVLCSMTYTHLLFRHSVARLALVKKHGAVAIHPSCSPRGSWEYITEFDYYSIYSTISHHCRHPVTECRQLPF